MLRLLQSGGLDVIAKCFLFDLVFPDPPFDDVADRNQADNHAFLDHRQMPEFSKVIISMIATTVSVCLQLTTSRVMTALTGSSNTLGFRETTMTVRTILDFKGHQIQSVEPDGRSAP